MTYGFYLGPMLLLLFGIALKLDVSAYWIIVATVFLGVQGFLSTRTKP